MKRELFQNIKVKPFTSGRAVERIGFLSLVIGAIIGTAGDLTLTITDSDDGNTFETVTDNKVFAGENTTNGALTISDVAKDDEVCVDIDLVGLKKYVKITASGTAAANTTFAIALGDSDVQPV